MNRFLPLLYLALLALVPHDVCAADTSTAQAPRPGEQPEEGEVVNLTYTNAAILGLVEGLTEYLPVSSTGHLILTNTVLGLDDRSPALSPSGEPIMMEEPSDEMPGGQVMRVKDAADAYVIIIQFGAIAAVVLLYWKELWSIAMGFLGRDKEGLLLGRNLLVAFFPAVVLGLALEDLIDTHLFKPVPVIVALFLGGVLMLLVERWRGRKGRLSANEGPELYQLGVKQSLMIGLLQCVAMWPGTSRSMMTLVGGYIAGLNPKRAAEFSFLLGLITLTGASVYKGAKVGPETIAAFGVGPFLVGCVVAAISAAIAIKWMIAYLTRHGLALFAYYRFALAAVFAVLVAQGVIGDLG